MSNFYDICIFKTIYSKFPCIRGEYTFDDLVDLFSRPCHHESKEESPLFAPIKLKAGAPISNDNVEWVSLCVLDVDNFNVSTWLTTNSLENYCRSNQVRGILYPTFSSYDELNTDIIAPQNFSDLMYWRVILGFPHVFSVAHSTIAEDLAIPIKSNANLHRGGVDSACFDKARRFFLPTIPKKVDPALYKIIVID